MLLIVPVPAPLLDFLIATNILLALVILLTSMFVQKPLDFSVFPSLLLVATLFRLGLNVASTRLILGEAHAGEIIQAFGQVTVGGNIVIGSVIFLILVVIQFVVVTKGAERVAEVGARFTLDAMPGKQMAIDADLNAGLITDEEAKTRRAEVSAEADFYGAMDGASKFVKGDAIAGMIILVINLVGGIIIGMAMNGMEPMDALSTYAILTIGDGLVTQIPALLMAVATGMIVTRSNAEADMGTTASNQLSQSRNALMIGGIASVAMALIPGMPKLPFILIGAVLIFASNRIKGTEKAAEAAAVAAENAPPALRAETTEDIIEAMKVQPLEITLAPDLVDLVSGASDDLLGRVRSLRSKIAQDIGVILPPVRTRDDVELPASTYVIHIAGVEAGRGQAPSGKVLALGDFLDALPGTATVEPVFGLTGKWIPTEMSHAAEMTGAAIIDRVSVLVTHLSAVVTAGASRLLSREDVRLLTESVKESSPSAVDELTPALLSLAEIQRVLQGLLVEGVPINDLVRIYEALTLRAKVSTAPEGLIEAARAALGPALGLRFVDGDRLNIIMLDPLLEQSMLEGMRQTETGTQIILDHTGIENLLGSLKNLAQAAQTEGRDPVLVCAPELRPAVRRLVSAQDGGLTVLSYAEVTAAAVPFETVGVIRSAQQISA
ncbi:MAG TPA: flagellar biosynthesis protein FlhA [Arthrobacter sp.]